MNADRCILLIEDIAIQAAGLRAEFEANGWCVERAHDRLSAMRVLNSKNTRIDVVALDLGLPPTPESPLETGLSLAAELRKRFSALPILAYTSLTTGKYEVSYVLASLLPVSISFINLRRMRGDVNLSSLLELVRRGFVLLSPRVADYLPDALADSPDPLLEEWWDTLNLLNKGLTYEESAQRLSMSPDGVRARLRRIAQVLQDLDELESHQTTREDLLIWYNRHRVRYRRP